MTHDRRGILELLSIVASIALLERYGGVPAATTAGLFRQRALAKKMLAGEARFRSRTFWQA